MTGVILDNDVLLKMAAWSLAAEAAAVLAPRGGASVLEVTAIVVVRQLQRSRRIHDKDAAAAVLAIMLDRCMRLEPTQGELELAADLETLAQERGVPLDSGESLIAAVAATRAAASCLTGDKRAIEALEAVAADLGLTESLSGKVACLEQLMAAISRLHAPGQLQARVCAEAVADAAMGLVFCCRSLATLDAGALDAGLQSYVEHIRGKAPALLLQGPSV
jgi:hypothetical protein